MFCTLSLSLPLSLSLNITITPTFEALNVSRPARGARGRCEVRGGAVDVDGVGGASVREDGMVDLLADEGGAAPRGSHLAVVMSNKMYDLQKS